MRNFNNWIKSVLINEYIRKIRDSTRDISVLDMGAGKGGDILKWKKANVSRVTFLDIAEKSLDECQNRYYNPVRCQFEANFIHSDATRDLIRDKIPEDCLKHDMVSSQFVIHYSFESFKQADTFLQNVSDSLKTGGYFIGTTTDANEVISRLKNSDTDSFGNDIYNIKFHLDERTRDKKNFPLFGVKFDFQLDNVVECPEFLINFDALTKLAKRHNLELVFNQKFSDFFDKYSEVPEYRKLISIMKSLEPFYSKSFNKSDEISEEVSAKEYGKMKRLIDEGEVKDMEDNQVYVTVSNSEWEAIQLYQCFAFVKVDSSVDNAGTEASVAAENATENECSGTEADEASVAAEKDTGNECTGTEEVQSPGQKRKRDQSDDDSDETGVKKKL